ncbi:hypothetical protein SUGI_0415440 [Cryptomeria japonica]|uniref:G patch domain-containing protein TGH isoform X2 n=1 Tax=Cryptomeria japonica TaxID=3369 RepID=UPI002408D053|nr:G patch domain-containing protein TGH isoform X2 [Cryptomeria japonica]XP_057822579.1 G patch domain-containing protein TGH isoform X2 [Cryptomeria japonica]GLJ22134.1 hypothetical protein SUGI_0415440 [Cryptomeria japonica]
MGNEDDGDYIFYGTPIMREEELQVRKRKNSLDTGQVRRLPPWKQEVTDEEGRRRFHGAFTGGFSAGFYNTVGSKEGWTPQTFTSSRKNRAGVKDQTILNFLDEDEKAELNAQELSASSQFDTFGFTAAEMVRKEAEKEHQTRPSAIPGPVPDELIIPAAESIGVKLLVKMGWRQGRSIGASHTAAISESRRKARKAFLALAKEDGPPVERSPLMQNESFKDDKTHEPGEDYDTTVHVPRSTPVFVIHPKNDLYGLGYDPFKNAPEFRERKEIQTSFGKEKSWSKVDRLQGRLFRPNAGKIAMGFGIGALEDVDEEDEDIYANDIFIAPQDDDEQPSCSLEAKKGKTFKTRDDMLPGFEVSSISSCRTEWFNPPVIPPGFVPKHNFSVPLEIECKVSELPPPEGAPPDDSELRMMIDGLATFVARSGKIFEDLSREKNANNPQFGFLFGGPGHDYYKRKLWEEQRKLAERSKSVTENSHENKRQKLNSEDRGRVLGETPLERSLKSSSGFVPPGDVARLQSVLSDTFTKPISQLEGASANRPFKTDPSKQARFEQFLKDKYRGGLRSTCIEGNMSDVERAQERLDFEAAAEIIEKDNRTKQNSVPSNQHLDLVSTVGNRFTSGGIETMGSMLQQKSHEKTENLETKQLPRREEHQWRPALLLCKRFNLLDPYAGKPPPLPKVRSKMDSLILISNPLRDLPETSSANEDRSNPQELQISQSQLEVLSANDDGNSKEELIELKDAVVKKPVDLYKAIFSDESDTEAEETEEKQMDIQDKSTQGANATLNRLIAGDFLESLGKELGLKVPLELDMPQKGKNVLIHNKEPKQKGNSESGIENDRLLLPDYSVQKLSDENPNASFRMHGHTSILPDDQKEASMYRIHEVQPTKDSKGNEEVTVQHGNGRSNYAGKSSGGDARNSGSSEYDRDKDNIKEKKRKRESGHREREKSLSKRHHRREHSSRDENKVKKRDRDKDRHYHRRHKNRKHHRRRSSSSSSSEYSK